MRGGVTLWPPEPKETATDIGKRLWFAINPAVRVGLWLSPDRLLPTHWRFTAKVGWLRLAWRREFHAPIPDPWRR